MLTNVINYYGSYVYIVVDRGDIYVNWLFVMRALFGHYKYIYTYIYIYMRSGRWYVLVTEFGLPGLN